jgi:Tfp pilus assembly protein FimT
MTLTELMTVLGIIGIVTAVTVPRVVSWTDRVAVRRSAGEVAVFFDRARLEAMVRGARVRVEFRADSLRAVLEDGSGAVVLARGGPSRHGVAFTVSRSVIHIHPNGLGAGGANTKLVVWRGAAAESLTTSRLGRLRWR